MSQSGLRVSPEQLIALNDEIAMLVRAGVPLELGLRERGDSVPAALRNVNRELSRHMQSGLPLAESLTATLPGLPRVYSAVVDAGLKSGNLPRALESLSRLARQGIDLRQRIEFAFLYPLTVFALGYVLFLVVVVETARRWRLVMADFHADYDPVVKFLGGLSEHVAEWAAIPPVLVAIPVIWWMISARSSFLPDRRPSPLLELIPGLSSVVTYWQWASFCDLLATLLEHSIPLPEALLLAADASGNTGIQQQMRAVAEDLKTGRSVADSVRGRLPIPAYLRWSLATAQAPAAFQTALRHGIEIYRGRANFRAEAIKMWLPPILIVLLGGGTVFVYAMMMALPLRALFWQLNLDTF